MHIHTDTYRKIKYIKETSKRKEEKRREEKRKEREGKEKKRKEKKRKEKKRKEKKRKEKERKGKEKRKSKIVRFLLFSIGLCLLMICRVIAIEVRFLCVCS
jgi:Flp pilus assembly protein TadB